MKIYIKNKDGLNYNFDTSHDMVFLVFDEIDISSTTYKDSKFEFQNFAIVPKYTKITEINSFIGDNVNFHNKKVSLKMVGNFKLN